MHSEKKQLWRASVYRTNGYTPRLHYFSCNKRCLCTPLAARDASLYCKVHHSETYD
jgi:hypothetical protein